MIELYSKDSKLFTILYLTGESLLISPCEAVLSGDRAGEEGALPQAVASASRGGASDAQLPDMPLRSDTQALRLIASILLIQRREKCPSREEKIAFP